MTPTPHDMTSHDTPLASQLAGAAARAGLATAGLVPSVALLVLTEARPGRWAGFALAGVIARDFGRLGEMRSVSDENIHVEFSG